MLSVYQLYEKHVMGTSKGDLSPNVFGFVCYLNNSVKRKLNLSSSIVIIRARALKHVYERVFLEAQKPEIFEFILRKMPMAISRPDVIYKNKSGKKRGEYCFVRKVGRLTVLYVLEVKNGSLCVVTGFLPKKKYLSSFEIVIKF